MKTRLLTAVAFVSAVVLCAPPARADPVTIDFQWTRFESVMAPPNMGFTDVFIETDVAKTPVFPVQGVPFSLPITSNNDSIDFYAGLSTHNAASFIANATADANVGEFFQIGTFSVRNGTWFGPADLIFTMTTVSSNPALDGHTYTDTLRLTTNPFVFGDPNAGADRFYLVDLYGATFGTNAAAGVGVYELFDSPLLPRVDGISNAGSFELWGRIGSLIPTEIRNPQGALFIDLFPTGVTPVPEPSEALLMLSGLAGMALFAKRRRRLPAR